MQARFKTFRWLAVGCALVAALTAAVLPSGLMPKVAGPCGRELCNCDMSLCSSKHCSECSTKPVSEKKNSGKLRLVGTSISNSDAPGTAYQMVFSGLIAPEKVCAIVNLSEREVPSFDDQSTALSSASLDIPTPPPRF